MPTRPRSRRWACRLFLPPVALSQDLTCFTVPALDCLLHLVHKGIVAAVEHGIGFDLHFVQFAARHVDPVLLGRALLFVQEQTLLPRRLVAGPELFEGILDLLGRFLEPIGVMACGSTLSSRLEDSLVRAPQGEDGYRGTPTLSMGRR